MNVFALVVACSLILFGSVTASSPARSCVAPVGVASLPASGIVIFGEMHGTVETPAFVAQVTCVAAQNGNRVIVALEWPEDFQSRIDDYVEGRVADLQAIKDTPFISMGSDGRTSNAMFALVRDVASMRATGHRVSVAAFDIATSGKYRADTTRDQAMADNVRSIASKNHNALILVLTGNIHSRKLRGTSWNAKLEPMTYLLRDLRPMTLNVAYDAGEAWVCDAGCGPLPLRGNAVALGIVSTSPMIALDSRVDGHDGYFYVGKLTASAPVK